MTTAIATSLECLVQMFGDPQALIYERLYCQHPEVKPLFVLDTDGSVRGAMLQTTLETIFDYAAKGRMDSLSLNAWRSHHLAYDVNPELFTRFFFLIRDCAKAELGSAWTADMESAWTDLLRQVRASETG
jgi:hemoglobin-like flavoprotein